MEPCWPTWPPWSFCHLPLIHADSIRNQYWSTSTHQILHSGQTCAQVYSIQNIAQICSIVPPRNFYPILTPYQISTKFDLHQNLHTSRLLKNFTWWRNENENCSFLRAPTTGRSVEKIVVEIRGHNLRVPRLQHLQWWALQPNFDPRHCQQSQ